MQVQPKAPRLSTAKATGASQPNPADLPDSQQFVKDVLTRRSDLWAASDKLLELCAKQGTKVSRSQSPLGTKRITVSNGQDKVTIVQGQTFTGNVYYDVNDGAHKVHVQPKAGLWGDQQTEITGDRHVTLKKKNDSLLGVHRESAEGDVQADIEFRQSVWNGPETIIKTGGQELTVDETKSILQGVPQVELKGPQGTTTVSLNQTWLGDTKLSVKGGDRSPAPSKPEPSTPPKATHPWWHFWG